MARLDEITASISSRLNSVPLRKTANIGVIRKELQEVFDMAAQTMGYGTTNSKSQYIY